MKLGKISDLEGFVLLVLFAILGIFFIVKTAMAEEKIVGAFDKNGKCLDYGIYTITENGLAHVSKTMVVPGEKEIKMKYINSPKDCK